MEADFRILPAFLGALTLTAALGGRAKLPELVFSPIDGAGSALPRLKLSDPERLRSAMDLVGLEDPGPPIRVVLAPEGSRPAQGVPPWISGYTDGVSGVVVLLPDRTPVYPDDGLPDVLEHEVTHVLIARAAGGHTVPRWFNEGLALASERSFGLRDRTVLSFELLLSGRVGLDGLSELFRGGASDSRKAYALSMALVSDMLETRGRGLPRALFSRMRRGATFDQAFLEVTGTSLADADATFWERQRSLSRWLPLVTSGSALWLFILALALLAFLRRRREATAARAAWEMEEEEEEAAAMEAEETGDQPPPYVH